MVNARLWYAIEQVAIKSNAAAPTSGVAPFNSRHYITGALASGVNEVNGLWECPRGMQSAGMTTNFNTEQIFQLGQAEIYENSERQPDIEITLSKVIDGSKPLFFMLTDATQGNDIIARTASYRADIAMQFYPDTKFRATGKPVSIVTNSGMYLSSYSWTATVDGPVTEDVTLVGNDKIWGSLIAVSGYTAGHDGGNSVGKPLVNWPMQFFNGVIDPQAPEGLPSGVFGHDGNTSTLIEGGAQELAGGADRFGVIIVGSGVQRREEVEIARSILPRDIPGVITPIISGINAAFVNGGFGALGPGTASASTQLIGNANTDYIAEHLQTITLSIDLGRDDIFELGSKRPFIKVVSFPAEVSASFEVITAQGDLVNAVSSMDCGPDNTAESNTIILRTCDGMQIDLGDANRLVSVDMSGGEAGGGNMTVNYTYQSFNVFNISHDFYQPNHRVLVFGTGRSRFNVGGDMLLRSDLGIF